MAARYPLHHEQPVVVPQVMHPTCRFQNVSGVHIGTILHGLPSARHALCEPGTTEHGQNTDTQSHQQRFLRQLWPSRS